MYTQRLSDFGPPPDTPAPDPPSDSEQSSSPLDYSNVANDFFYKKKNVSQYRLFICVL